MERREALSCLPNMNDRSLFDSEASWSTNFTFHMTSFTLSCPIVQHCNCKVSSTRLRHNLYRIQLKFLTLVKTLDIQMHTDGMDIDQTMLSTFWRGYFLAKYCILQLDMSTFIYLFHLEISNMVTSIHFTTSNNHLVPPTRLLCYLLHSMTGEVIVYNHPISTLTCVASTFVNEVDRSCCESKPSLAKHTFSAFSKSPGDWANDIFEIEVQWDLKASLLEQQESNFNCIFIFSARHDDEVFCLSSSAFQSNWILLALHYCNGNGVNHNQFWLRTVQTFKQQTGQPSVSVLTYC